MKTLQNRSSKKKIRNNRAKKIIQHHQALGKFMEELSKQNYIQFPLMATIK